MLKQAIRYNQDGENALNRCDERLCRAQTCSNVFASRVRSFVIANEKYKLNLAEHFATVKRI